MSEPLQLTRDDNNRRKQIRHYAPVGTIEDLRKHGLDPGEFGSCAPKNMPEVIGCPAYHNCPLAKIGVQRFGVRIIKSEAKGGNMRLVDMDCYSAVTLATQAKLDGNGDIVEVVAREGESIRVTQSVPVKDALGVVRSYTTEITDRIITPYPKISDNKELLQFAVAGAERKRHEEMRADQERERAISNSDAMQTLTTGTAPDTPQKPVRK